MIEFAADGLRGPRFAFLALDMAEHLILRIVGEKAHTGWPICADVLLGTQVSRVRPGLQSIGQNS